MMKKREAGAPPTDGSGLVQLEALVEPSKENGESQPHHQNHLENIKSEFEHLKEKASAVANKILHRHK